MQKPVVAIIGATSFIGSLVIDQLLKSGYSVIAYTRKPRCNYSKIEDLEWRPIAELSCPQRQVENIDTWLCLAPIWVMADYLPLLEPFGIKYLVAISSTSRFTKLDSGLLHERRVAQKIAKAENLIERWVVEVGGKCIVLRTTLIYGRKGDENIASMVKFIKRFGFFPVLGRGNGLRQPLHAKDLSGLIQTALNEIHATSMCYQGFNVGGRSMQYKDMVRLVFSRLGKLPIIVAIPKRLFLLCIKCMSLIPAYRGFNTEMVMRMEKDLYFDTSEVEQALGFSPKDFYLEDEDLL